MKNLHQTCAATILTLALTVSVFAGQIDCPGAPSPAPTTQSSSVAATVILTLISLVRR
jgi:hypothetical protein